LHNLYKMAASPPEVSTYTEKPGISLAAHGYLFLGPRLGNSLLKFTSHELGQGDWLDTELDEFEVYSRQETAAHRITACSHEVGNSPLRPLRQVGDGRVRLPLQGDQEAV
jgi:hypothetical protein